MKKQNLEEFISIVRGDVIFPQSPEYHEARKVYNGMIDKKPMLIVKCVDVADIIASVNFGRDNKLLTAVRGGGHNAGGLGICDNGLVIDLSGIKFIRVNTSDNTVRVGGGNVWGEVESKYQTCLALKRRQAKILNRRDVQFRRL